MRRGGGREAGRADVGDAVALRIAVAGARVVDEVGAEAVGRAEAGTLAEQDEGGAGTERVADFVLQGDTGEGCDDQRGEVPFV